MNFSKQETECSCEFLTELDVSQLVKSDLVFKGEVLEKRTEKIHGLGYRRLAVFKVNELIRGELIETEVEIGYELMGPCTIDFYPRNEYLIVANAIPGVKWFSTGYCFGNRRIRDLAKKEIQLLDKFQQKKPDTSWESDFGKSHGKVINGKPEGLWEFYNSFQLLEKGYFKNGKRQGDWIEFSKRSWVCQALGFAELNCDLSTISPPHPEGWISKITPYENGLIHGIVSTYQLTGCIESETIYNQGILVGPAIYY